MSQERPPPPEPEECLIQSRVSSCKGGTLIAEDVLDLATHLRRLADPDGYRPERCPRCGGNVLHVHDYLERKPRDEAGTSVLRIVRHVCADPACEATWRILPAFLARCLWRTWSTVERATSAVAPTGPRVARIPRRTTQRWQSRLASAARQLVVLLATTGGALLEAITKAVGLDATRRALVDAHTRVAASPRGLCLAAVAALVHRIERGIRLM